MYEAIVGAGEQARTSDGMLLNQAEKESVQLGFAQNYYQHSKCVIEHSKLVAGIWREYCAGTLARQQGAIQ